MRFHARTLTAAMVAAASLSLPAVVAPPTTAAPPAAADPAVVTTWNAIAARTIYTENATPVPASPLYFGFVSVAMYDAVVTIKGGYERYAKPAPSWSMRAYGRASAEVAAATAAYQTLRHFFPSSTANLDNDYTAFLGGMPQGSATSLGKLVGERAAKDVIRLRRDDGRNAAVTLNVAPGPGVWRPTPDAFALMAVAWLGFVKPLVLDSQTQIPLDGPDPITSAAYAADVAEVKAYGVKDGSLRSTEQTQTALFYSANPVLQYQVAMRDAVTKRGLDIVESARAFAILSSSTADAMISCWRAKYDDPYWRPVTAIREADTDGNDATAADPTWTPLVATPPYPDYTSGHACVTGATSSSVSHLFGEGSLDWVVSSSVTGTTRVYDTTAALDEETINARIWLGFHFRKAMTDGNQLGHDVSDVVTSRAFRSVP